VHEEFHSFGPNAHAGWLYKSHGKVAEEVTTEVLARDVLVGSKNAHSYPGSYQEQIRGVLDAMRKSTKVKRTHVENFQLLVTASKTYKQSSATHDLMDQLHGALKHHADDFDAEKLRKSLRKVKVPGQDDD
jgi:hypothetical protein